uniref:Aminotransferase-like plant mobile domain-containing protein n=1 Tax=Solanum tuberosum TaxID=4113 RepID=M1E0D8_SOLTU
MGRGQLPRHKEILELIKVYDAVYTSLFTYDYDDNVLHAFCELWRPSTNTLSTFVGEMSISLWDLQAIGGIPVQGHFYDEVVPSAKELTQTDTQKELLLPQSCRYLFSAFYILAKDDLQEVSVHDWVKFWFRGPNNYAEPPQKVSKENAPFVELDVEESLRDETNLAAFFACWLCKFVLLNKKVNYVRASVFKVGSLMAHGKKFSLAVPVLASIYRGLKEISTSLNSSVAIIIFPIHYVYGWLGEYFGTHHRANRSHRSIPLCKISGEKMAKCFNFTDAQKLFQQDDARRLHHLAMLQGRDLHLTDNGKLSNSWNEYIINLRSSYVTLRHDSNFIVESYSPTSFSRQFDFCQDVPGDLMERPYDEGAPLMTREYVDWWPSQRLNTSQGNLRIILKKTKQDSTSISSKGASDQSKEKSHPSSKSQVKSNDTLQVAKTSSKSKTSKDKDVPAKSKLRRLTVASKAASPAPKVGHGSFGTNELHVSSDNGNDQTSNLEMPCDEISHLYVLPDGVGRPNASPSPTDRHWNRPKRKAQELDDVCCGIDILDIIVIDDNDFVDEDSNSASLFELAKQLDLQELYGGDLNNGAVADFTVDLNDLDAAAKDFHSSINDDQLHWK